MRFYFALIMAKMAKFAIKIVGKWKNFGGSNYPGELAMKLCPDYLDKINKPETIVMVTGTNGKTTLCNMITDMLEMSGKKVLTNRLGSNMLPGMATSFTDGVGLGNKTDYEIAILEMDERSAIRIFPKLQPDYLVVTQLARDSCRRNAHPHYIFSVINNSLPSKTKLILNGDDIIGSRLGTGREGIQDNPRVYYTIDRQEDDKAEDKNIINDMRVCPNCYSNLEFDYIRYNHVGKAHCPSCGMSSPDGDYRIKKIERDKGKILVEGKDAPAEYRIINDSIFNIYNELAAISFLSEVGIPQERIIAAVEKTEIVDTRYKRETVEGIELISEIAKGQAAAGISVVCEYLTEDPRPKELIFIIEDEENAGKSSENFSYIYDTDFEFLTKANIVNVVTVGARSKDLCLRMMLAGLPERIMNPVKSIDEVTDKLLMEEGVDIHILYDNYEVAKNFRTRDLIKEKLRGGKANV